MDEQPDNPFTPDAGIAPPVRVGHEDAVTHLDTLLARIRAGKPGGGVVLVGPRGNGKTVLLNELAGRAAKASVTALKLLSEDLAGGTRKMARRILLGKPGLPDLSTLLPLCGLVIRGAPRPEESLGESARLALRWQASRNPTLLVIDEAHVMPLERGRHLFNAAQELVGKGFPLLLVLAGTPGVMGHLKKTKASFIERYRQVRIGRLESLDEVRTALSVPAGQSGFPIDGDALELLAESSQRYPFFVQQLGFEAWQAAKVAGHPRIALADAQAGKEKALKLRDAFYRNRRNELKDQKVLAEALAVSRAVVGREDPHLVSEGDLLRVLGEATKGSGRSTEEVLGILADLGLVWEADGTDWEPGIPSFCRYLIDFAAADESASPLEPQ